MFRLSFIFQSYNLIAVLTAFENMAFALELMNRLPVNDIKERTMGILKEVGLELYLHHKPNELSGGQQQRVGIAVYGKQAQNAP
ncbi:MAG: ATP-binding cassette domain-containing protein [Limnochordia bacterium]|jgi:putative ABC transport system ATP-binding protein